MDYNIYALTVAGIALGVLVIYFAALTVISDDIKILRAEREAKARQVTYYLSLIIAIFCFGVWLVGTGN